MGLEERDGKGREGRVWEGSGWEGWEGREGKGGMGRKEWDEKGGMEGMRLKGG